MQTKTHLNNPFLRNDLNKSVSTDQETTINQAKTYIRSLVSLHEKQVIEVPRNNPEKRFNDFGIIPWSKYTINVYLRICELFFEGMSPDQMIELLHNKYPVLREARISREFIKKAIQLSTAVLMPETINLVPKDGQWSLMVDGTTRAKDDLILFIISAVPLNQESNPVIIPLVCDFIPSENVDDISLLLHDLKPRLPSLPKSIISDFRPGILDAISKIFPDTVIHGCHYHIIEMIANILIYPTINQINKKIRKIRNGIIRWSHHNIHSKLSEDLNITARTLKKLCTNINGEFGGNLLNFLQTMQEIQKWVITREKYFTSNKNYLKLYKLLSNRVWREIKPLLSQLKFCLDEFMKLRKCLTTSQYKTAIEEPMDPTPVFQLDNLIHDWAKIGGASDNKFNLRFKKSAIKLQNHYNLIIPALIDPTLYRTTSLLENLNSQIKRFLRKWSGTRQILRSFDWAAPLAAICRSLSETDLFGKILENVTSYDWIEKTGNLARKIREYKLQVLIANNIASKSREGLIHQLDFLIMRGLTS